MANNMILEKLEGVKTRFIEVGDLLTQPEILSDMKRYIKLNKERRLGGIRHRRVGHLPLPRRDHA